MLDGRGFEFNVDDSFLLIASSTLPSMVDEIEEKISNIETIRALSWAYRGPHARLHSMSLFNFSSFKAFDVSVLIT